MAVCGPVQSVCDMFVVVFTSWPTHDIPPPCHSHGSLMSLHPPWGSVAAQSEARKPLCYLLIRFILVCIIRSSSCGAEGSIVVHYYSCIIPSCVPWEVLQVSFSFIFYMQCRGSRSHYYGQSVCGFSDAGYIFPVVGDKLV